MLGSTERRCVGGGATEHTHHVGQRHGGDEAQSHGHQRAQQDDGEAPHVECHALVAHQSEEVGAHVESKGIDKECESEGLGKVEHTVVYVEPEVSGNDAEEEHEGNAQGNALDMYLAQHESTGNDERQHHSSLQCRMDIE